MKILRSTVILFSAVALLPVFGEELDDETALELGTKIAIAERSGDFDYLAEISSPRALEYFRRMVSIYLDRLEETYSPIHVERVIGSARSDLSLMSDKDFVRSLSEVASNLRRTPPEDSSQDPYILLGILRDGPLFHALFRVDRFVESDSDAVNVHQPWILSFIRSGETWELYSIPYGHGVPSAIHQELALPETEEGIEQAGGGYE